jgi:hypothetical protein
VTQTNQQLITDAFGLIGVVADGKAPTSTQSSIALTVLNDNMATQIKDGWTNIGWYPQAISQLASNAPLRDADIADVKYCLAAWLATRFAVRIVPSADPLDQASLSNQIKNAFTRLTKRYLLRTECDLGELSRPQGGPWGGPNYFG